MPIGDVLIYGTVRAAVCFYVASIVQQLLRRRGGNRAAGRSAWTIGCGLVWVHVALAMHFVYGWDHELMIRETARQTGESTGFYWGGGAYLNYVFMIVWGTDAAWWWLAGEKRYRRRAVWVSMIVHGFLAFIAINAVVVFAKSGWVRWAGVIGMCAIVLCAIGTRGGKRIADE
jgi:hypothetical protein